MPNSTNTLSTSNGVNRGLDKGPVLVKQFLTSGTNQDSLPLKSAEVLVPCKMTSTGQIPRAKYKSQKGKVGKGVCTTLNLVNTVTFPEGWPQASPPSRSPPWMLRRTVPDILHMLIFLTLITLWWNYRFVRPYHHSTSSLSFLPQHWMCYLAIAALSECCELKHGSVLCCVHVHAQVYLRRCL